MVRKSSVQFCLALVIPRFVWCGTVGVSLVFHLKAFNSTIIRFISSWVSQLQQTDFLVFLETVVCFCLSLETFFCSVCIIYVCSFWLLQFRQKIKISVLNENNESLL